MPAKDDDLHRDYWLSTALRHLAEGLTTCAMAQLAGRSRSSGRVGAPLPPQNLEAEESVLGAMMLSRVGDRGREQVLGRRRLLSRVAREDLPGRDRPLPAGPARRRDHRRRQARRAGRARRGRRQAADPRDRDARAGHVERRPLREDRPRDGDAARPHGRRRADPAARLGTGPARRPSWSTGPSRWCSTSPSTASAADFERDDELVRRRASSRSRRCTSPAAR